MATATNALCVKAMFQFRTNICQPLIWPRWTIRGRQVILNLWPWLNRACRDQQEEKSSGVGVGGRFSRPTPLYVEVCGVTKILSVVITYRIIRCVSFVNILFSFYRLFPNKSPFQTSLCSTFLHSKHSFRLLGSNLVYHKVTDIRKQTTYHVGSILT